MVAFSQLAMPDASKAGAAGTAPSPAAEPPAAPEAPPPMPKG